MLDLAIVIENMREPLLYPVHVVPKEAVSKCLLGELVQKLLHPVYMYENINN